MQIRISTDQPARAIVIRNDGTRTEHAGDDLEIDIEAGEQVRIVEQFEQPETPPAEGAVELNLGDNA